MIVFSNGSPSFPGLGYCFLPVTTTVLHVQPIYFLKNPSCATPDCDEYNRKLDRILDLLEDQQYSQLHKLVGTMTLREVACFMCKSTRSIERCIAKGLLKAVSKAGNADLFHKKDVVQLYVTEYKRWPKQMP